MIAPLHFDASLGCSADYVDSSGGAFVFFVGLFDLKGMESGLNVGNILLGKRDGDTGCASNRK